jgi:hypothetical protein
MDNDIDSIDRKIKKAADDDLDGIESCLDHIDELDPSDFSDLQDSIKEILDDCSKANFKKVGKFLVNLLRKEE